MAKDNGRRKSKSRGKSSKNHQPVIARWLWVVTALVVGGLITFLLVITRTPTKTESAPNYPVNSTPPVGTVKPKTKFDFYEKLTNKQVNPPVEQMQMPPEEPSPATPEEQQPQAQPNTPPPAPAAKPAEPKAAEQKPVAKQYYLQVGAFNKFDDADQLKAELTLMGFPVVIQSVNNKGDLQFRVRSGPFATKAEADATKKELQDNGYASNLIHE